MAVKKGCPHCLSPYHLQAVYMYYVGIPIEVDAADMVAQDVTQPVIDWDMGPVKYIKFTCNACGWFTEDNNYVVYLKDAWLMALEDDEEEDLPEPD